MRLRVVWYEFSSVLPDYKNRLRNEFICKLRVTTNCDETIVNLNIIGLLQRKINAFNIISCWKVYDDNLF